MQKPLALSLAVCLGLAGCQIFEKSETWDTVLRVRPGDTIHEPDDSAAYAEKLHRVLLEQGVEHIVVTYQFHYYTNHYEGADHAHGRHLSGRGQPALSVVVEGRPHRHSLLAAQW